MDAVESKYYVAVSMVMTLIAVIFLFLIGTSLLQSTKSFRLDPSTELSSNLNLHSNLEQEVPFS